MNVYLDLEWNPSTGEITEGYAENDQGEYWKRDNLSAEDIQELSAFIRGLRVVGHNISADLAALRRASKAMGELCTFSEVRTACTLKIAKHKLSLKQYRLEDVACALGIQVDNSQRHTAEYDALLTKEVYLRLLNVVGSKSSSTNRKRSGKRRNARTRRPSALGW